MHLTLNVPDWERWTRGLVGLAVLALVFVGPRTAWGWAGLVPLATALTGYCPLYRLRPARAAVRN